MLGRLRSPGSSPASAPASTSMPPTRLHTPMVHRPAAATSTDSEAHLRNRTLLARAPLVPLNLLLEKGGRHGHRHRRRNTRHHRPDPHLRPVSGRGVAPIHQQPRKGHEHDRTHRLRAAAHLRPRRWRILASWQRATEGCAHATLIVGPSPGSARKDGARSDDRGPRARCAQLLARKGRPSRLRHHTSQGSGSNHPGSGGGSVHWIPTG